MGTNENLNLFLVAEGRQRPEGIILYTGLRGWESSIQMDFTFLSTCLLKMSSRPLNFTPAVFESICQPLSRHCHIDIYIFMFWYVPMIKYLSCYCFSVCINLQLEASQWKNSRSCGSASVTGLNSVISTWFPPSHKPHTHIHTLSMHDPSWQIST